MKIKGLIALILLILSAGIMLAADIEVTIYCDEGYPPYSYSDNGVAKGIYIDILKAAFSKMTGYKITIMPVPWKRGLELMKTGEGFALLPPYYRPKDRPWMDYSVELIEEELVIFAKEKTLENRKKWIDDFTGLIIGINSGFSVISDTDKPKIKIEEAKDNKTNILKLGMGRIDGYINDKLSILYEYKNLKNSKEYNEATYGKIISGPTVSKEMAYLSFTNQDKGKFTYKNDFIKKLKAIMDDMKKKGDIKKIVDKWTK